MDENEKYKEITTQDVLECASKLCQVHITSDQVKHMEQCGITREMLVSQATRSWVKELYKLLNKSEQ